MKVKIFILTIIPFLSINVSSETFICIGDKGAEVKNIGKLSIKSEVVTAGNIKLILSDESGDWVLKYHGGAPTGLDKCINGTLCETSGDKFGGFFLKNDLNVFTFHAFILDPNNQTNVTDILVKGLCTSL